MIRLDHVTKAYNNSHVKALDDVCLEIEQGEFVFIVGDSGAGKSTIFKLLTKELEPTSGEIYIDGQPLSRIRHSRIPMLRRKVGVVFQDFRLLEDRNVYDNIAFAQRAISVPPAQISKNVTRMLTVCGISEKYRAFPKQLSGGEQQRVAVARALVNKPEILLADEPTGNLDAENARAIMELLERVNKLGTTVIVVTHNQDFVRSMRKRVVNLKKGVVVNDIPEGGRFA